MPGRYELSDDHLRAIGALAAAGAAFERLIELLIWDLVRVEEEDGLTLTHHSFVRTNFETLYSLLKQRGASQEDLSRIRSKFDDMNQQRNRVIHANWIGINWGHPQALAKTYNARSGIKISTEPRSPEEIEAICDSIEELSSVLVLSCLSDSLSL